MAIREYKCPVCGFQNEYIESSSVSKTNWHPEICPKCNKSKLEKVETFSFFAPSVPGTYQHNKKIDKINQALMNPNTNHNTNPY